MCIPNRNVDGAFTGGYHCECLPDFERITLLECTQNPTAVPTRAPTSAPTVTVNSPTLSPSAIQKSVAPDPDDDDRDWYVLLAILIPLLCCLLLFIPLAWFCANRKDEEEVEEVVMVAAAPAPLTSIDSMRRVATSPHYSDTVRENPQFAHTSYTGELADWRDYDDFSEGGSTAEA